MDYNRYGRGGYGSSSPIENIDKVTTVADWFFGKASVFTGVFLAMGCLAKVVAIAAKLAAPTETFEVLDQLGTWLFYFGGSLALLSIIVELRKGHKQSARIAAERIICDPNVEDESVVPEVQAEIHNIRRRRRGGE